MGNVQGGPQGGTESGSTLKWSKSGKRRKLGNESGNWTSCEGRSKVKKLGRKKGLWVKGGWHRGEVERDNQSVLEAQNRSCTHTHTHTFLPPHIPVGPSLQLIAPCPQSPSSSLIHSFFNPSLWPCWLYHLLVAPHTHTHTHTQPTPWAVPPPLLPLSTPICWLSTRDPSPQCALGPSLKCTNNKTVLGVHRLQWIHMAACWIPKRSTKTESKTRAAPLQDHSPWFYFLD